MCVCTSMTLCTCACTMYVCMESKCSICFACRCPDDSKIGDKMIYASTKDTIKKSFSGLSLEFQANDSGDMDYNTFAEEVEKKA